jgi:hypothetical protein
MQGPRTLKSAISPRVTVRNGNIHFINFVICDWYKGKEKNLDW